MLRLYSLASVLAALAPFSAADGGSLPILFQPLAEGDGFAARAPGLEARFHAAGFDLALNGAPVAVRFEGKHVEPTGIDESATRIHRIVGRDRARWSQKSVAYEGLRYQDVWPGVDVRVHTFEGRFEYDLEFEADAHLESAVLRFDAAGPLSLDPSGSLIVPTLAGPLYLAPPTSWEVDDDGTPLMRESCFVLVDDTRVRMAVDGWSGERPLVVDPVLVWSRYVGGSAGDEATSTAVAADGSIFVTGWTRSGNFPITGDAFDERRQSEEGFLLKLANDGETLEWVTFFGGRDVDRGTAVTVDDATGQAVVVGRTQSSDFPSTAGAFRTGRDGVSDGFVARFSADGANLVWSTYLGGSGSEEITDVELDSSGDVYVTGLTTSNDYPVVAGSAQTVRGGRDEVFFTRLSEDGRSLIGSTYVGGSRDEIPGGLAVDGTHVWIVGTTKSSDFPVTSGAFDTTRNDHDAFVVRMTGDAREVDFATFLGGRDRDEAKDVAVFSYLGAVVCGTTRSNDFPVTDNAAQGTRRGLEEGFLALVNRSGNDLVHSTFLGGTADDVITSLTVDEDDSVWLCGMSYSSDWTMTDDAVQSEIGGAGDAFVIQYDPRTGERVYASFLGGTAEDQAMDVAVDPVGGTTVVVGYARSGLPKLADGTPSAPAGARDAFIARFDHGPCGAISKLDDIGGGCGITLSSTVARLGRPFDVTVEDAPANMIGMFLASTPTDTPYELPGGCLAMIDVGRMWVIGTFQTDANGDFQATWNVSEAPDSCGTRLTLQALVYMPGQGPTGIGWLSNALTYELGD